MLGIMEALAKASERKSQSKPSKQALAPSQVEAYNRRLEILLPQFKKAVERKNLNEAKNVIADLQSLLRALNKTTKLVELKNQLFELAFHENQYDFAIEGFMSNRNLVNSKTRLHLEATALLAIAYLRKGDIEKARPFITDVLKNENVIKSPATRAKFHREIIERFNEEISLFSLKTDSKIEIDNNELYKEALKVHNSLSEDQLYEEIGKSLPKSTKELLYEVDKFSKNQLPYHESKTLAPPTDMVKNDVAGKTVFSAIKLVVYKSLCDPKSEVYKIWYTNAVGAVVDKRFIYSAITLALAGVGIGLRALIVSVTALILRFGLDIYCEKYKPASVTALRRKSK